MRGDADTMRSAPEGAATVAVVGAGGEKPSYIWAMWVKTAAIRPVPAHAQIPVDVLDDVEAWLGGAEDEAAPDEEVSERRLGDVFERFERGQPALAQRIGGRLARTKDDVAVALGYFLCLSVWLAFDRHLGERVGLVDETAIESVDAALRLDEELRGEDPSEAVDSDDVIAMEQPHVIAFVAEHIDAALEVHASDVDVDAVHAIYRLVLIELLALSYAVAPPEGSMNHNDEIFA